MPSTLSFLLFLCSSLETVVLISPMHRCEVMKNTSVLQEHRCCSFTVLAGSKQFWCFDFLLYIFCSGRALHHDPQLSIIWRDTYLNDKKQMKKTTYRSKHLASS
ncbi:hypothetical protein CHARACLAT_022553 [Characodon lateralis]|uniref:Secreted protein n=1 Tax=Characodon lateralis TaxID=208331 RepID=A0ABU7F6F8_9TELE|nr:hypothetical protein [Characodon lateralis]